jgi:hypothetical protein
MAARGAGASIRHLSVRTRAGTAAATRIHGSTTACVITVTLAAPDGTDCRCSEEAQQVSACGCVRPWSFPEPGASAGCIGHESSSEQHVRRAWGVGSQPAQSPVLPAHSAMASNTAETRLQKFRTSIRMVRRVADCQPRTAAIDPLLLETCGPRSSRGKTDASH